MSVYGVLGGRVCMLSHVSCIEKMGVHKAKIKINVH